MRLKDGGALPEGYQTPKLKLNAALEHFAKMNPSGHFYAQTLDPVDGEVKGYESLGGFGLPSLIIYTERTPSCMALAKKGIDAEFVTDRFMVNSEQTNNGADLTFHRYSPRNRQRDTLPLRFHFALDPNQNNPNVTLAMAVNGETPITKDLGGFEDLKLGDLVTAISQQAQDLDQQAHGLAPVLVETLQTLKVDTSGRFSAQPSPQSEGIEASFSL